jgi:hypothetical protein
MIDGRTSLDRLQARCKREMPDDRSLANPSGLAARGECHVPNLRADAENQRGRRLQHRPDQLEEIDAARSEIAASDVLVCQLEIPLAVTLAALRLARREGVRTVFNPAPARPELPAEIYTLSDIFCPNESETEMLTGMPVSSSSIH